MNQFHLSLMASALCAGTAFAQSSERQYVQRGSDWYVVSGEREHLVLDDRVSVRFRAPVSNLSEFAERGHDSAIFAGLSTLHSNRLGVHDLAVPPGTDIFELLTAFRASGDVEFAEESTVGFYTSVPNDPQLSDQYYLINDGAGGCTAGADIGAELAWELTTGDPSIAVAVIDSGTSVAHSDLAGAIWQNPGEIPGNGIDDDSNGFVDDVDGWNFEFGNGNVTTTFYHGTAVAGIVGMRRNNGIGMAGIAGGDGSPESGCRLMPLPVGTNGPISTLIDDAVLYAIDNGARIITLSLSAAQSDALDLAFVEAAAQGVFVNNAAGNGLFGPSPVSYPATHPDVVSVAGTTCDDTLYSASNTGPENWIAAGGLDIASLDLSNGYQTSSGTSFASPQVAGAVALMLSLMPSLTPEEVKAILRDTAVDLGTPGFDNSFGWGRMDLFAALIAVVNGDCDGNGIWDATDIANGDLSDVNGNQKPDSCEALVGGPAYLSVADGGTQLLRMNAGPASAGEVYVVLGSASGIQPGVDLGDGIQLPLNADFYTNITLESANSVNFEDTVGTLDGTGKATALINLPTVVVPALQGLTLHHAFAVLDAVDGTILSASNALRLDLLP